MVTQDVSEGIFKGKIKPLVGTISGVGLSLPIGSSLGFLGDYLRSFLEKEANKKISEIITAIFRSPFSLSFW